MPGCRSCGCTRDRCCSTAAARSRMRQAREPPRRLAPRIRGQHHAGPVRHAGILRFGVVRRVVGRAGRQVGVRAAAEDAVVRFPEAAAAHDQHLGRRIVVELADRAPFRSRELRLDCDARQHRERQRAQDEVALDALLDAALAIDRGRAPALRRAASGARLRSPASASSAACAAKARRQPVGAADDLVEALRPDFEKFLANRFGRGGREFRFLPLRHRQEFDGFVG